MLLYHTYIISLKTMDLVRLTHISTATIVQDKTKIVLCSGTVHVGLHQSITLNFLIAGHTKFAPDGCFGLLKRAFKRSAVSSLKELAQVIEGSACLNEVLLVDLEDGTSFVPVADWQAFSDQHFRPLPDIKKYHHFRY